MKTRILALLPLIAGALALVLAAQARRYGLFENASDVEKR